MRHLSGNPARRQATLRPASSRIQAGAHARLWAGRLVCLEPWLALPCALLLLLHPHPLSLPAALLGALPSLARWLTIGRPWRPTAFDLPLTLLVVGGLLGAYAGLFSEGVLLRLLGLEAGLILYAAVVEHAATARQFRAITLAGLALTALACLALVNVAGPFLRLDRLPPLGALAEAIEPLGIVQPLLEDEGLLQRYRFYASGVGALANVGLALVFAVLVGARGWGTPLALGSLGLLFGAVLLVSDSRGSILSAALTLGALAALWRPQFLLVVPLVVLTTINALALGLLPRGLNLRTLLQRFWFWDNSLYLAQELPLTGAGLGIRSVQFTYTAYFQPAYPPFFHAHNIYLQALLEQGIVGLAGLIGLTLAALWVGWRSRGPGERWNRTARLAGLGVALALFSTGLSEVHALTTVGGALLLAAFGLLAAAAGAGGRPALTGAGLSAALPSFGRRVGARLRDTASVVRRRSSSRTVRLGLGAIALLGTVTLSMPGGLGSRALGRVLLNVGTAELNRVTIPEGVPRAERARSLDRAVWLLEGAAGLERTDPAVQRNLALALAARRDGIGARESLERARMVTSPADQRGQFQLGRAYVAAEAWPEAIRAWEAADAGPQLDRLGDRLLRARSHDQSIAAYGAAARAEPGLAEAYAGLARAARERGDDLGQMVTRFESLIARGGLNEYYGRIQVARAYREAGRPIDALESLRLAERVHRDPDLDLEQGAALTQSGRHEEAALLLRGVTDSRPQDANGWYWLGVAEARQGSYEAAIATARTGLAKLAPSRRAERGPLLAVIGDSLLGLGRAREALAAYEEGQTLTPGDRHLAEGAERARLALAGIPGGQP